MPDPHSRSILRRRKALNLTFDASASNFDSGSGWMTTDSTTSEDGLQSAPLSATTTLFNPLSPPAINEDLPFPAPPARCESPKASSPENLRTFARRAHKRHRTHTSLHTAYLGSVIPPPTPVRHRTLVLCFDGTGDQFDDDNSNIVQFFSMLKKGDKDQQLCYYQAGIGTYTIPQIATPFWSKLTQTVDLMIANSLDHHVMGGYEFLMENCSLAYSISERVERTLILMKLQQRSNVKKSILGDLKTGTLRLGTVQLDRRFGHPPGQVNLMAQSSPSSLTVRTLESPLRSSNLGTVLLDHVDDHSSKSNFFGSDGVERQPEPTLRL